MDKKVDEDEDIDRIVLISEAFGGHKMKKTSYKNTQFVLIGMAFFA